MVSSEIDRRGIGSRKTRQERNSSGAYPRGDGMHERTTVNRPAEFAFVLGGAARSPRSSNLGISKAQVDPVGRLQATGDRLQVRRKSIRTSSLKPQASSQKGQESELTISPIQLLPAVAVSDACR